jgi:hypothetical protein
VQHTVVGVAGVAVPDAWPPLAVHVPSLAVGAVVSSTDVTVTPTDWQPAMFDTVTWVPVQLAPLKSPTCDPVHEVPAGEPHEQLLHARESLTPP